MPHTSFVHSITISLNFSNFFSTLSTSPTSHTSYFRRKLYWYDLSFTLFFSSPTFNTFLTPSIHPPISAELPPKNGQTFFHLLLSTLSHLTVFQAFVLVTTHIPSAILNHVYLYTSFFFFAHYEYNYNYYSLVFDKQSFDQMKDHFASRKLQVPFSMAIGKEVYFLL